MQANIHQNWHCATPDGAVVNGEASEVWIKSTLTVLEDIEKRQFILKCNKKWNFVFFEHDYFQKLLMEHTLKNESTRSATWNFKKFSLS